MRLLLRAFVLLETALVLAGAAGANGGGDAAPSPPSMRLSISKRCNESIMASNYNAGFQSREDWEFKAWRTYSGFLKPILPTTPPRLIVDVGCGFALYDIHVHRHYGHAVKIIYFDSEGPKTTTKPGDRGFKLTGGWHANASKMPFYHHDRSCVREIAMDNGVPEANAQLLSASAQNLAAMAGSVDLIYSHMSWGFHYPVSTYASAAFSALRPGGKLFLTVIKAFTNKKDGYYNVGKTRRHVNPADEIADAVAVGFRCAVVESDYRRERLSIVVCIKPER